MKKVTEQIGKTVEEAIRKGLEELKVARDEVEIDIIEEPVSGGILGVLESKLAKVRLTVAKKIDDQKAQKTIDELKIILQDIFNITGDKNIEYNFEKTEYGVSLYINSEELAHLIGYRGRTIEAFQLIINSILQRENNDFAKVFIEINDYKKKREEKLRIFADRMADNVLKYRKPIKLEPMTPYERMIIHKQLAKRNNIETESVGEEPNRRVIIKKRY